MIVVSLKMIHGGDKMRLKEYREKANMTQAELADKVGMVQSAIAMIESGKNELKVSLAKQFGEILDVDWKKFYD